MTIHELIKKLEMITNKHATIKIAPTKGSDVAFNIEPYFIEISDCKDVYTLHPDGEDK